MTATTPEPSTAGEEQDLPEAPAPPPGASELVVLLLFAGFTIVHYWRAFASGVISDGWVLLEIGSRGLVKAPLAALTYHLIPVANLYIAVLWKLFGLEESWYQILNLAQLTFVGWLVYRLGRHLFTEPRISLLAGLLFLANASFYDIPLWPVIGNFHSLCALFYLASLFAVHLALRSARPTLWAAAFAASSLAAFLTYEPAVSVLVTSLLFAIFMPAKGAIGREDRLSRRLRILIAPLLLSIGVVSASKLWALVNGYTVLLPPDDFQSLTTRLFLLVRAVIALFTLRGSDSALYAVFSFGSWVPAGSGAFRVLLAVWLLALLAAGTILMTRPPPAVRFLTAWLAVHLVVVSAGVAIVSRHFFLAALPASLLASWILWRVVDRCATLLRITPAQTGTALALTAVSLLVAGARSDLDTAAALHREVTQATRQVTELVRRRLATNDVPQKVVMVNMPATLSRDGLGLLAFGNGLKQQVQLTTERRILRPLYFHTYDGSPAGRYADKSRPIALGELSSLVRDAGTQVLMFDRRALTVVELDPTVWQIPQAYSLASAPFLDWQSGSWPWLRVHAGQVLELPLAVSEERSWVGLRYRWSPEIDFSVAAGTRPLGGVQPQAGMAGAWPALTFPASLDEGQTLTIHAGSEVWLAGVWSFAPPSVYTPEMAPFLGWNARPFPAFTVAEPLALPLAAPECANRPCALEIEFLAERGRDFTLVVEGGLRRDFSFGDLAAPEWRSERLPAGTSRGLVVHVEPRGQAPLVVRRLAWLAEKDASE